MITTHLFFDVLAFSVVDAERHSRGRVALVGVGTTGAVCPTGK